MDLPTMWFGFSMWNWLLIPVLLVLVGIPQARIIYRAGYSPWWVIAFLIPGIRIVALWLFAFIWWPALHKAHSPT